MVSSRVVASELEFVEGPVWTNDGWLLVTSISRGKIYQPRRICSVEEGTTRLRFWM